MKFDCGLFFFVNNLDLENILGWFDKKCKILWLVQPKKWVIGENWCLGVILDVGRLGGN